MVLYAGLYGACFYATRGWSATSDSGISQWQFFGAFATYAATILIAVGLCVVLTRKGVVHTKDGIGWPIGGSFWWRLPVFLGCGVLGAVACFVIPLVNHDGDASGKVIAFFCVAHFLHGAVLGLSLLFLSVSLRIVLQKGRRVQTACDGAGSAHTAIA